MKIKNLAISVISLILLGSCNNIENKQNVNLDINTLSTKTESHRTENLVNKSRIQNYLGALSGVKVFSNGKKIPERGTRNGRNLTREFLTETLEKLGYEVEKHNYRNNGTNILVKLMAEKPTDEYILVGAHMDSVRNSGADDNGSGSTAVLEAATVLKSLKNRKVNIIFAWFDEEEIGLVGSKYMARDFKKKKMNISTVHTVDMLGWDNDGDSIIELARPDGIIWDYYQMVNETHNLGLKFDRTSTGSSDHVSFSKNGFDAVCISEEWTSRDSTPHYHRKSDKYDTINFDFLTTGTKLLVAAVGDLSLGIKVTKRSDFISHDKFPNRERHFHKFEE